MVIWSREVQRACRSGCISCTRSPRLPRVPCAASVHRVSADDRHRPLRTFSICRAAPARRGGKALALVTGGRSEMAINILAVDDDVNLVRALVELLKAEGYQA